MDASRDLMKTVPGRVREVRRKGSALSGPDPRSTIKERRSIESDPAQHPPGAGAHVPEVAVLIQPRADGTIGYYELRVIGVLAQPVHDPQRICSALLNGVHGVLPLLGGGVRPGTPSRWFESVGSLRPSP
jgi:hypothetical protein